MLSRRVASNASPALKLEGEVVDLAGYPFHVIPTTTSLTLMSVVDGVCIATATLSYVPGLTEVDGFSAFYFNRLFIRSQYRNKGVGSAMVREIQERLRRVKHAIILDPNPYDGPGRRRDLIRFYKRAGFKKKREGSDEHWVWTPDRKKAGRG